MGVIDMQQQKKVQHEIKSLIFTDNYLDNYRGLEVGGVIRKILYLAGWKLKKN